MSTSNLTRPGGGFRPGRLLALLSATAVAASLLSAPPSPAAASTIPAPSTPPNLATLPADAEPTAVTLITGDTVLWHHTDNGSPRVEIEQAPRDYPVTFGQSGTPDDFYIIPTDAMKHVVAGTLDRELFNIPGLIRQGLDDATADELPVIVTFDRDRGTHQLTREAEALPATSNPIALKHLNGAGVTVDRDTAGAFRQTVLGNPDRFTRTAGARGLDGAVERILLDRTLTIDLAESVPQIGAPQAWDAGYTGEGVTVAVLDTGVDTTHPDLAGQVISAANFTDESDATDTHGHGTHVASIIAGTGAASDGARTGVAPGANLLIGKVCFTDAAGDGRCPTSSVMAGMEWAAEHDADVVNMSLGSGTPSDGTDPLSQLVNQLSAETDTLFVTSAGNSGNRDFFLRVVGSPAAADAALAVGAVDKADKMARFSSRGPRVGDHAVKPEITAPGVDIVAARAAGTGLGEPVDDAYTSVDGTSMASPHVAGAAALLAQARGLTGQRLKDALVSTASDRGHRWYAQGTGRIDIPAALDSPIHATGTVNLGGIDGHAAQDITYTNHTNDDITLTLQAAATDLDGQPANGLTLSTDRLTVPAHGEASVTLTVALDPSNMTGQEAFGGVITATGTDIALRTGIGFGPPLHRVDIEVLDSNGDRIGSDTADDWWVTLTHDTLNRDSGGADVYRFFTNGGAASGHVPTGKYTIITIAQERDPAIRELIRMSFLVKVEVDISADMTIVLDARQAIPIEQPDLPRKAQKRNHAVMVTRTLAGADGKVFTEWGLGGGWPMYVTPAPAGQLAPVGLFVSWTLAEPQPLNHIPWDNDCPRQAEACYSETPAYVYNIPFLYENGIPGDLHERITRNKLVEVPTRFHSDHPDALIRQTFQTLLLPFTEITTSTQWFRMWFRPGAVTEYFLADDRLSWLRETRIERRPEGMPAQTWTLWSDDRFPVAEAGARRGEERWHEAPSRMGVWEVRQESVQQPTSLIERQAAASRNGPNSEWFVVPFDVMGNTRGHGAGPARDHASWRMWNTDAGTELEFDPVRLAFPLEPGEATYRLEQIEAYPPSAPFRTGPTTTTWTFTSRPSDARVPPYYLCRIQEPPRQNVCQIQPLIRLEYDLGLDIHNQATAGRAHRFVITAGHHSNAIDRAEVTELTVHASFDDGDTWQNARVVGEPRNTWDTGGFLPSAEPYQEFKVVLMTPPLHRTTGSVTLRVQATDANGGTIYQTIHRAFLLK